ncbi:MAG TPA: 16S rRNA (adenine(1518)-N(6)/adenine(1519)-N(6))-dimethyltransferase RsmA [Candidatus Dormibacteraeota bacterium]|nr:16S rRNA (adenine(1518)-N(6)/adenine(1519)-N(6))-dimethyltransferase RsmA [Candidatus Dormibacteraeota bacterium]
MGRRHGRTPSTCSGCSTARTKRQLDLTNPATIRAIARRFGIRFQRRWGQNFLADRGQLDRIVEALALERHDQVVEVGAGIGTLTVELAKHAASVAAIEIDPACIRALRLTLRDNPNTQIVEGNVLDIEAASLVDGPYRVAGNIPYNLTGALLVHLLEQPRPPARIDLLVQQEVAERIAAPPGGWSLATLGVRVFGEPELVLRVPRTAFVPPPQVDSALLRIVPAAQPVLARGDLKDFFTFVTPFFQVRRKQLPYTLVRQHGLNPAEARARLGVIGIDPVRRPETLSLEEWRRLFESARRR